MGGLVSLLENGWRGRVGKEKKNVKLMKISICAYLIIFFGFISY